MEGAPNEQPPLEPLPPVVAAPPAVPPPVQESAVSSTVADAVAKAFSVAALPPNNEVAATWPTVRDRAPEPAAPVGFRRPPRRWIKEEDDQLLALIGEQLQNGNTKISWTGVAERMEHRTSKQCRERYTNNLDPSVGRKGNWTADEDVMIRDMQHRIGNKWTKIAAALPGRSDNDVKNRWHAMAAQHKLGYKRNGRAREDTNVAGRKKFKLTSGGVEVYELQVGKRKQGGFSTDNIVGGSAAKPSPGAKLSESDLNVCQQLLNLQGKLKGPDADREISKLSQDQLQFLEGQVKSPMKTYLTQGEGNAPVDLLSLSKLNAKMFDSQEQDILATAAMAEDDKKPAAKKKAAAVPVVVNRDLINPDPRAMSGIEKAGPNDIMTGRGGGTNHHPGNIKFRRIVEDLKPTYQASTRSNKPVIAMKIVSDWRVLNPPGRFLAMNKATGLWDDIGDESARNKCSQALREKHTNKLWLNEDGKSAGFKHQQYAAIAASGQGNAEGITTSNPTTAAAAAAQSYAATFRTFDLGAPPPAENEEKV